AGRLVDRARHHAHAAHGAAGGCGRRRLPLFRHRAGTWPWPPPRRGGRGMTQGWVMVAGLGPGDEALVTPEVTAALAQATDVIGYIPYVARVAPRPGLTLHPTDNRAELDRAQHALDLAATGARVVIVS